MSIEVDIPDDSLNGVEHSVFKVRGKLKGSVHEVAVRQAFGNDLIEANKSSGGKLAPAEQLYALIARVTALDGRPMTIDDLRRLPLGAVTKITKEFNALNGDDLPLEE